MEFTIEQLRNMASIEDNYEFYVNHFNPKQKFYSKMNKDEKQAFKKDIKAYYYKWLFINDSIIESSNGNRIMEYISKWLINQNLANYISKIANSIVDAHRSPLNRTEVNLDKQIRAKNQNLITNIDNEQNAIISAVKAFASHYNSNKNNLRMRMQF